MPRRSSLRLAVLASLFVPVVGLAGCRASHRAAPEGETDEPDRARSTSSDADASASTRAPLGGTWLEDLGDEIGVVAIPLGTTERRPVVVSLHGAGGAAEWACGDWMGPTHGYPFIVCPRTHRERKGRLASWSSVDDAVSRSAEALARVRSRYGAWIADGDPIYVGFSQGAEMVVAAADRRAMPWSALFVHEGGWRQQSRALARLLGGPHPVYATCSTWGCGEHLAMRRGPQAHTADYGPHGHFIGGPVAMRLRADFAELVRGREVWAAMPGFHPHADAGVLMEEGRARCEGQPSQPGSERSLPRAPLR